ncbi:uncharacterized protein LOC105644379 isoform X2 [Jatropha curcas]|uniref:uncharacterized protein LOC105644379 isoform X2 n=1 Tax=Jatropha curcas TaxID=180498 RepID=UPI0009D64749|nr:uncharacterized protein LOC105644379 isoform X2 [Jatropha curcas]
MESFPDFYPLTSLQIGDIKSYLSRTFLYFAPSSHKFFILVDNQSWWMSKDSRANCIREFMITQCRVSPFINTRALLRCPSLGYKSSSHESDKYCKWLPIVNVPSVRERALFAMLSLYKALHGFIVFEVAWKDVRGINYLNELQTDTSLALEVKSLRKWEFNSINQALSCIPLWFSGTTTEAQTLWRSLNLLLNKVSFPRGITVGSKTQANLCSEDEFFDARECPADTNDKFGIYCKMEEPTDGKVKEDPRDGNVEPMGHTSDPNIKFRTVYKLEQPMHGKIKENPWEDGKIEPIEYKDTLLLLRFNDRDLPSKLRQVITSDLKLLTLLEAGLPSWVIFLQSYPLFNRVYCPWMRPLLRVLYAVISSITVIIGFYDLYKNVPLLRASAAHLYWPFFKWIEAWDMISRIRYLGTMLFLQNLEKAVEWFLMKTQVIGLLALLLRRSLIQPLSHLVEFMRPIGSIFSEIGEQVYLIATVVLQPLCSMLLDLVDVLFSPLELLYSIILNLAFKMLSNSKGLLIHFAKSKPSTSDISIWRSLRKDLFKKVFQSLKNIICGIITFLASCNRHRLSIYNYCKAALQQSPHLLQLAPLRYTYHPMPQLESPHKVGVKKQRLQMEICPRL